MTLVTLVLTLGSGALIAAAALGVVRRRRRRGTRTGWLTDAMVRDILAHGRIETDAGPKPPLDLEEIRREEDRFWGETWDRPEPHLE